MSCTLYTQGSAIHSVGGLKAYKLLEVKHDNEACNLTKFIGT